MAQNIGAYRRIVTVILGLSSTYKIELPYRAWHIRKFVFLPNDGTSVLKHIVESAGLAN